MSFLPYHTGVLLAQTLGVCTLCRRQPTAWGLLCEACDNDIVWLPPCFNIVDDPAIHVQMASFYEGALAAAIGAFKDRQRLDALPFLVHCLSKLAQYLIDIEEAVILPIPTTNLRLLDRGFYPVGVLAAYLSAMTDFDIYDGVVRLTDGVRQRGLDRQQRLSNLSGVFELDFLPEAETVIIFDDVSTTGATFLEVTKLLLRHNSRLNIHAVCLAHGSSKFLTQQ
ncbi:MAG: hypothetical protein Q4C68_08750 [Moraxella sp.]|nr:hypothetical protein [Moraxella sp.]